MITVTPQAAAQILQSAGGASLRLAARASTSSMNVSRKPSSICSRLPGWLRVVATS